MLLVAERFAHGNSNKTGAAKTSKSLQNYVAPRQNRDTPEEIAGYIYANYFRVCMS